MVCIWFQITEYRLYSTLYLPNHRGREAVCERSASQGDLAPLP